MADLRISDLVTASQLKDDDYYEIAQAESGTRVSYRTTLLAIAVQIATVVQLTSDLTTDSKTLVGAINELKRSIALIPGFDIVKVNSLPTEDIDTHTLYLVPSQDPEAQNSCDEYINTDGTTAGWELVGSTNIDLSDYYTKLEVDGLLADKLEADDFEANQTASANQITLETKQAGLAKSCAISFGPIQDLHGYPNPWAGGAGKNKFQTTATSTTINGVTFTVNSDGSVRANGTASGNAILVLNSFSFDGTSVILNGCPTGGSSSTYKLDAFGSSGLSEDIGNGVTISTSGERNIRIVVFSGVTIDKVFYPMIRLSTVTDATFAPYSNICPISGRTEASVKRTGKNIAPKGTSGSKNNVTFTVADNGSVSTSNTANGSASYNLSSVLLKANTTYIISGCPSGGGSGKFGLGIYKDGWLATDFGSGASFTPTEDITAELSIRYWYNQSMADKTFYPQVELGSTATAYEPYTAETKTHQYQQEIFGGEDDFVNGGLTVTKDIIEYDSGWSISSGGVLYIDNSAPAQSKNVLSNYYPCTDVVVNSAAGATHYPKQIVRQYIADYTRWLIYDDTFTTAEDFNAFLASNPLQICYELAAPNTIQLSPEAVTLLKGLNIISTDGDKVQVEFSDIPVGDYSVLLDYIKSLEARIEALEG